MRCRKAYEFLGLGPAEAAVDLGEGQADVGGTAVGVRQEQSVREV